ncbi:MAG: hypothetical protein ACC618_02865, partial [Patescibacteria group bacterium]
MTIFGISIKGTLAPNIRILIVPAVVVSTMVVLVIVAFHQGFSRISSQLKELEEAKKIESVLQEKVDLLRQLEGEVLSQADISLIAMPEKNPSILTFSQLTSLATEKGLEITERKARPKFQEKSALSTMRISYSFEGNIDQIVDFLQAIKTYAPVTTVGKVDIELKEVLTGEVSLTVYWGDFPKELPALTEPIKNLDTKE